LDRLQPAALVALSIALEAELSKAVRGVPEKRTGAAVHGAGDHSRPRPAAQARATDAAGIPARDAREIA